MSIVEVAVLLLLLLRAFGVRESGMLAPTKYVCLCTAMCVWTGARWVAYQCSDRHSLSLNNDPQATVDCHNEAPPIASLPH